MDLEEIKRDLEEIKPDLDEISSDLDKSDKIILANYFNRQRKLFPVCFRSGQLKSVFYALTRQPTRQSRILGSEKLDMFISEKG